MANNSVDTDAIILEVEGVTEGLAENSETLDDVQTKIIEDRQRQDKQYNDIMAAIEKGQDTQPAVAESYSESLADINEQLVLNNQISVGLIAVIGVLCGICLFRILWDRFLS